MVKGDSSQSARLVRTCPYTSKTGKMPKQRENLRIKYQCSKDQCFCVCSLYLISSVPPFQVSVVNVFASLPPFPLFVPCYCSEVYFYAERTILSSIVIWWPVVVLAV